jgi:glycerol-3-phosphate acyltransferase PlsX
MNVKIYEYSRKVKVDSKLIEEKSPVSVVYAPEIIDAHELPTEALKKQNSSISISTKLQKEQKVDAFVSAGNTGTVMASSLITLGRLGYISRPALGTFFPTKKGFTMVLDMGANSDCKPLLLLPLQLLMEKIPKTSTLIRSKLHLKYL